MPAQQTTTDTDRRRLFTVWDRNGGFVARRWITTETNARRYFAREFMHPTFSLIGPTGLVLSQGA